MPSFEDRQLIKAITEELREQFGKGALNAQEFGEYLGIDRQTVSARIYTGELPGYMSGKRVYQIPIRSIAIWEVNLSKTKASAAS